jgi:hypothetical protein
MIEPRELFFGCGSAVAAADSLKADKKMRIPSGANIVNTGRGKGRYDVLESLRCGCHKRLLKMTKTELELALAEATRDQ